MPLKVLIASTTWFALPARAAISFSKANVDVSGIVPRGNPLAKVTSLKGNFRYSAASPLRSMMEAIRSVRPDLIVPCDDRTVEHLHRLHAENASSNGDSTLCSLIERSLGSPKGYSTARSRSSLLQLAEKNGIRIPQTGIARTLSDLAVWLKDFGFPLVLKVDGTWGGTGVRLVHSWNEAEQAFLQLTSPLPLWEKLRFLSSHDYFPLFEGRGDEAPEVTVQQYVAGRSANSMFACWQGQVLGRLSVETLYASEPLGSSTIVRTIENIDMEQAGHILVGDLAMSGLCGLDFIIEEATGKPFLIELNPRATQLGHLELGGNPSLIHLLSRRLAGDIPDPGKFVEDTIAFFPHILRCRADFPLSDVRQDIPWEEPLLVGELMKKPWNRRHLSSLLYAMAQKLISTSSAKHPQVVTKSTPKDFWPKQ